MPEGVNVCKTLGVWERVDDTVGDRVGVNETDAHSETLPVPDEVWDEVSDTDGDKLLVTDMVIVTVWAAVVDPVTVQDGVTDKVGEVEAETLSVTVGV